MAASLFLRRRSLVGLAIAAAALPWIPADAEPGRGYEYLASTARAGGINVRFKAEGFLPVSTPLDLSSTFTEARLESALSTGLAAMPYPGDFILNLPGTIAGLSGQQNLPGYPLAARADHPFAPKAEVVPPGGPGRLEATAAQDQATATAALGQFAGQAAFSVGSVQSSSVAKRLSPDAVEVTARSVLSDLVLGNGAIRIGSVTSVVELAVQGSTFTVRRNDTVVGGVTAGGQPATIDESGLHFAGQGTPWPATPLPPGLDVRVGKETATSTAESSTASAGALLVHVPYTFQGTPTSFDISFGGAVGTIAARAGTVVGGGDELVEIGGSTGDALPGAGGRETGLAAPEPSGPAAPAGASPPPPAPAIPYPDDLSAPPVPLTTGTAGAGEQAGPSGAAAPAPTGTAGLQPAAVTRLPRLDFRPVLPVLAVLALALVLLRWLLAVAGGASEPRSDLHSLWRW